MKTAQEFLEKIKNDEAFAKQVAQGIQVKKDAGAKDYIEALIPTAAELGYEITGEQVEGMLAKQTEEISVEELGKTAGGTSCWPALTFSLVMGGATMMASGAGMTVAEHNERKENGESTC